MPFDFSYNPGVQDISGQLMAQGLAQAGQAVGKGIQEYRQKQKDKEAEDAAVTWLKANGPQYGLPVNPADDGELKAAVKAAGGGAQAITMISQLQTQKQARDAQAQLTAERQAKVAQDTRNLTAAQAAVAPITQTDDEGDDNMDGAGNVPTTSRSPTGDEMIRNYIGAGGDPSTGTAQMLVAAAKPVKAQRKPEVLQFPDETGKMHSFIWDGASAPQRVADKPVKQSTGTLSGPGKLLADAKTLEGQGDTDGAGLLRDIAAKQGADKPMALQDFLISGGNAADYRAYVDGFKKNLQSTAPSIKPPAAAGGLPMVNTSADFEKLKKGDRFQLPDGRTGIKK